ncbi:MAG: hypothetical protein L0Z73_07410 [Gammaproteobacteria bacterium]|nr:hypothetical protein [Gammaproteobacteria bacterium]
MVNYNIYFGYLHAHSEMSDGQGSPDEAYAFARDVGQLDFIALTDHGELLLIWPWQNKWQQLVDAAQAAYLPDSFVSLWGFEWSNPFLGHLNNINSSDFTHTLSEFWLFDIYDWIAARPDAFARFNHPGDYDFLHLEFYHFSPYAPVQNQMVGIETWNGGDSFDAYFYPGGYNTPFSYLDEANQKQWYLGALGGQDNHQPDWGIKNEFRTAVLAESLTREAIVDAYRNRRFYATEDKNLELRFSANDYPMGSRISGIMRNFLIEACDGDTFSEVRIYRNGNLLETRQVSGNCIREEFTYSDVSPAYYYTIVKQNDDNNTTAGRMKPFRQRFGLCKNIACIRAGI